jgi:hypothetical protein
VVELSHRNLALTPLVISASGMKSFPSDTAFRVSVGKIF